MRDRGSACRPTWRARRIREIERIDDVREGRHEVHRAAYHQRLPLVPVEHAGREGPRRLEFLTFAVVICVERAVARPAKSRPGSVHSARRPGAGLREGGGVSRCLRLRRRRGLLPACARASAVMPPRKNSGVTACRCLVTTLSSVDPGQRIRHRGGSAGRRSNRNHRGVRPMPAGPGLAAGLTDGPDVGRDRALSSAVRFDLPPRGGIAIPERVMDRKSRWRSGNRSGAIRSGRN